MKGVSAIVVVILILLITVSLAALAYTFFTGMLTAATEEATEAIEHSTSSMLGRVKIDSINVNDDDVHIRNVGEVDLDDCVLYVNDDIDNGASDPGTLAPGDIRTINAGVDIASEDKVKVTCNPGGIATRTAQ